MRYTSFHIPKTYTILGLYMIFSMIHHVSFAQTVDCSTQEIFTDNECNVCYENDAITATKSGTSYSINASDILIEWKNESTKYYELIYEDEQIYPTIISNLSVTKEPAQDESFWKYSEAIMWTPFEGVSEFMIQPGGKVNFRTVMASASFKSTLQNWPQAGGHVMIKSPLVYREHEIDSFTESDRKVRNYCAYYEIEVSGTGTTNTSGSASTTSGTSANTQGNNALDGLTDAEIQHTLNARNTLESETSQQDDNAESQLTLNAAAELNEITAQQTQTPTGPEHVFLIVVAAITGAWLIRRRRIV